MPIELTSNIIPKNNGSFPTHEAIYGRGGRREVDALTDRDAIPAARRVSGMEVYVRADQKKYILQNNLTSWIEDPLATRITAVEGSLSSFQPLSSNLTNLSNTASTAYGRSLLTLSDAVALRTAEGYTVNNRPPDSSGKFSTYAFVGGWEEAKPLARNYPGRRGWITDVGFHGGMEVRSNGVRWYNTSSVSLYEQATAPNVLDLDDEVHTLCSWMLPGELLTHSNSIDIEPVIGFTNVSPTRTISLFLGSVQIMSFTRASGTGTKATPRIRLTGRNQLNFQYNSLVDSRDNAWDEPGTSSNAFLSVNCKVPQLISLRGKWATAGAGANLMACHSMLITLR